MDDFFVSFLINPSTIPFYHRPHRALELQDNVYPEHDVEGIIKENRQCFLCFNITVVSCELKAQTQKNTKESVVEDFLVVT